MARRPQGGGGAPEWIVTFADLMSLLLCFFILLISFSTQDKVKLEIVAGAIRNAFGVQPQQLRAGIIERQGMPTANEMRNLANTESVTDDNVRPDKVHTNSETTDPDIEMDFPGRDSAADGAAAAIRQALQEDTDMMELARQIIFEETPEGIEISLTDSDARAMFGRGASGSNTRLAAIAAVIGDKLRAIPNRLSITGHTARNELGGDSHGVAAWELSTERANTVRSLLAEAGITDDRFDLVAGEADTAPLFAEDASLSGNRRVTILVHDKRPVP